MESRTPLEQAREALIAALGREIKDPRVLEAFSHVARERFVPRDVANEAYENRPLPIGHGQTISQPLIVAMMTEALQLSGSERVLEVGTGSGYQAALLSHLAASVVSVERVAPLAAEAVERLQELAVENVTVHVAADDALGWPADAPYEGIIVTAAAPEVPMELLEQLAMGGRLVIPVGGKDLQELVRIVKTPEGALRHNLGACRFVPLVGRSAWPEGSRS